MHRILDQSPCLRGVDGMLTRQIRGSSAEADHHLDMKACKRESTGGGGWIVIVRMHEGC